MDKNTTSLGKDKILPLLLRLSLPSTFAMFINALYNVVDAIFVGRGVSRDALGGLAVAFPLQMIIMSIGFLIGLGTASLISRSLGAKDYEKAKYALGNAITSGVIIAIILTILVLLNLDRLILLFGATPELTQYAKDYLSIIMLSAVFMIMAIISNNIIRAQGNATMAMISMVSGAVLNIALDPLFIFVFKMGIKGAALATAISQTLTFIVGISYIFSKRSTIHISWNHLVIKLSVIREIVAVGFSGFIRQVAGSVVVAILNNVINTVTGDLATLYISIFGVINRIITFMLMPMFGVVQAFLPIAGFNFGAKKYIRVKEAVKITLLILIGIGSVATLIIFLFTKGIIGVFTDDLQLIDKGYLILRTVVIATPFVGFQIISAVLFQALGKAKPALFLALLRQLILLIPLLIILPKILGVNGIWMSFPISDAASVMISFLLLKREVSIINKMHLQFESS